MVKVRMLGTRAVFAALAAVATGVFVYPTILLAQQQEPFLEEIVVTAQRRAQTLQVVPIAIEVFR